MVFVIMAFYMDDAYFNLLGSKAYIVLSMALIYGILMLIRERERIDREPMESANMASRGAKGQKKRNLIDISIASFVLIALISTLFSKYKTDAFWGHYGWAVGSLYIFTLGVMYYFVSRNMQWKSWMYGVITGSATAVFLWAITDECYMDIFGMHMGIEKETAYNYLASIGNNNWFSGYWAMILPFFFFGLRKGPVWRNVLVGAGLFIAIFAGVNCRADSLFLGLGVILGISLLRAIGEREKSVFTGLAWMITGVAMGASKGIRSYIHMIEIDEISLKVMNSRIWMILFVVGVILMLLPNMKGKKYIRLGLLIAGIAVVLAGVYAQAQQFGPTWGTLRGDTWMVSVRAFGKGTFLEKIFGIGPDCFGHVYYELTGSDWFRNAHNEYLQYLITMGIAGVISYVMIYVAALREGVRSEVGVTEEELPLKFICFSGIMAYGAQAVVNNPQALNGAIFFTLLAILRGVDYTKRDGSIFTR